MRFRADFMLNPHEKPKPKLGDERPGQYYKVTGAM